MTSSVWAVLVFDSMPAAFAIFLIVAANRLGLTARGQCAWAHAFRILGGRFIILGLLGFLALQFILALSPPESEWKMSEFGIGDSLIWCSGPFLTGLVLWASAWLFGCRARRTAKRDIEQAG